MTASELIYELAVSGVKLQTVEGKIQCTGPASSLTSDVLKSLQRLKPDVLAILGNGNSELASNQVEPESPAAINIPRCETGDHLGYGDLEEPLEAVLKGHAVE